MSFDNTIKLVKLQRATLVQAIQTIDDHFYAIKQPKEILELREALDKVLNHNKDMDEGSEMELTKIKLTVKVFNVTRKQVEYISYINFIHSFLIIITNLEKRTIILNFTNRTHCFINIIYGFITCPLFIKFCHISIIIYQL